MIQRFHFDLTNGEDLIRDDEGVDASSPNEAIEEARSALDDMRRNEEAPREGDGWQLIVRDESGETVKAISLDDAVQQHTASDRAAPLRAHLHGLKDKIHGCAAVIIALQCLTCL